MKTSTKGICAAQARTATECTKCGAAASQLWASESSHTTVADCVYGTDGEIQVISKRVFQIVPVQHAANPNHAHCRKCAETYRARLERRAEGKAKGQQAKVRKANLTGADCMTVATSLTTGLRYDRTHNLFKRLSSNYDGTKKGPQSSECGLLLQAACEKRGMVAIPLGLSRNMSPAKVVAAHGHRGNLVILAWRKGQDAGHAMSSLKGKLHNAHGEWDTKSEVWAAYLVTKR